MPAYYTYLFFGFIILALFQLWIVIKISNFPAALHKTKRKWINIVLAFPLFGAIAYIAFGKTEFKTIEKED